MRELMLADVAAARAALDALEAKIRAAEPDPPPAGPEPSPIAPPPPTPSPGPRAGLTDARAFFDRLRASDVVFGHTLTGAQVRTIEAILTLAAGRLPLSWAAYCLATAYHEAGLAMVPIRERGSGDGSDPDPWDDYLERYDTGELAQRLGNTPEADGDGIRWAGRGLVQITGARNYAFADRRLRELGWLAAGESLVATPDLALRLDVAAAILVFGMLEGWFTGKRLRDYLLNPATPAQFAGARRIVNGLDRAELIARYALEFQDALTKGGWL